MNVSSTPLAGCPSPFRARGGRQIKSIEIKNKHFPDLTTTYFNSPTLEEEEADTGLRLIQFSLLIAVR